MPTPVIGPPTDPSRLAALGAEGVTAMICNSTNALREGRSPSELDVARSLAGIIKRRQAARRRHHLRLQRGAHQGRGRCGPERRPAAGGGGAGHASHHRAWPWRRAICRTNFKYHDQEHFSYLEPDEVVLLCTGSQGEPRAAMARIAEDEHPDIELDKGDLVIFSSRTIPGNERAVGRIQNRLVDLGCEIVTDADALVHVTGHPRREELKEMYGWVQAAHRHPHARRGAASGRARQARARCGRRGGARRPQRRHRAAGAGRRPRSSTRRPVGRLFRDGDLLVPSEDGPVRERRSLAFAGIVIVALARSGRGELSPEAEIALDGVPTARRRRAGPCSTSCAMRWRARIASIPRDRRKDGEMVREAVRRAVRSAVEHAWGKRPIAKVLLTQAPR